MNGDAFIRAAIVCLFAISCTNGLSALVNEPVIDDDKIQTADPSKEEPFSCKDCPPFVAVPTPPEGMRRITHAAAYELTWSQYLVSVEDRICTFPLRKASGDEFTPEERRKFNLNWTATKLGLSDVACFKAWLQKRIPTGYSVDIPTGREWIWLARAGSAKPRISPQNSILLESRQTLGGPRPPASLHVPVPDRTYAFFCGPVGRMPPNAWGLYDMFGQEQEITSGVLRKGPSGRVRVVELRGGGCLTPVAKVPIDDPLNAVIERDGDTVMSVYAVRFIITKSN